MVRTHKTFSEQRQSIVNKYIDTGQEWPASKRQIASWAIVNKLWYPQRSALIDQCAEELARAMREEYITDAQGRSVRAKHAARTERNGEQMVLWADIRTAPVQHMQISLQQRRQQIVGDCKQLKSDADSYNENYNAGPPIQLSFDFTSITTTACRFEYLRCAQESTIIGPVQQPLETHRSPEFFTRRCNTRDLLEIEAARAA